MLYVSACSYRFVELFQVWMVKSDGSLDSAVRFTLDVGGRRSMVQEAGSRRVDVETGKETERRR